MATRRSLNISTRNDGDSADPIEDFLSSTRLLLRAAGTAKKHRFRLLAHSYYGPRAQEQLTVLRRNFLVLRNSLATLADPEVSSVLNQIELLVDQTAQGLNGPGTELHSVLLKVAQIVGSDLTAAVQASNTGSRPSAPFLPPEIVPNGIYRRVLEEANDCYRHHCYNACAAMLRRLIESLIIEVFEKKNIEDRIMVNGDYQELKALIGKAVGEQKLRLGRNTRDALPKLKFFGDLSVHSRRNLVREPDLERLHGETRVAIEELAEHMQ